MHQTETLVRSGFGSISMIATLIRACLADCLHPSATSSVECQVRWENLLLKTPRSQSARVRSEEPSAHCSPRRTMIALVPLTLLAPLAPRVAGAPLMLVAQTSWDLSPRHPFAICRCQIHRACQSPESVAAAVALIGVVGVFLLASSMSRGFLSAGWEEVYDRQMPTDEEGPFPPLRHESSLSPPGRGA